MQIVALVSPPIIGPDGADNRALAARHLDAGVDVVGGARTLIPTTTRPRQSAGDGRAAGSPLDLHIDETLDPSVLDCGRWPPVVASGFRAGTVASHCAASACNPSRFRLR